ncbi:hypothetical protein SDC9_200640 [bioreactor metagenome]|uniref:Uncharacterized protein n=1 Tax=bioreactor metagenome TaxID=1076179 RepID=A0A645IP12_9ZZZZ
MQPFGGRHAPLALERRDAMLQIGDLAQQINGRAFQHRAHVIELLEHGEVDAVDHPAQLGHHRDIALALQAHQRLAHGGAAHAQPGADFGFGEAVTRDVVKVVQRLLELRIGRGGKAGLVHGGPLVCGHDA